MTRVVITIGPGGPPHVVDAQVEFHLAAGAVAILVGDLGGGATRRQTAREDEGRVHRVSVELPYARTALGRAAASDHGAEWIVDVRPGEFWWPRGEGFQDVLAPMPPRYGIVQGLVRRFVAGSDDERPLPERATVRRSLLEVPPEPGTDPTELLRPAYRTHPDLDLEQRGGGPGTRQPLRAWYPFEVLTLPGDGEPIDPGAIERGLADGTLVVDERLRDALAAISAGRTPSFPVPDVVDDAAYAGECAAVGEVDLESLDRQIRELERRVVELEARFWPRVVRFASRVVRRGA
jgi:hypothetical protein